MFSIMVTRPPRWETTAGEYFHPDSEASSPKLSLLKRTWYLTPDLKYPRKVLDSEFCSSLYCTGPPPRKSSSCVEKMAAAPLSSCEHSSPAGKRRLQSNCLFLSYFHPLIASDGCSRIELVIRAFSNVTLAERSTALYCLQ